jgi:hypothetical protein
MCASSCPMTTRRQSRVHCSDIAGNRIRGRRVPHVTGMVSRSLTSTRTGLRTPSSPLISRTTAANDVSPTSTDREISHARRAAPSSSRPMRRAAPTPQVIKKYRPASRLGASTVVSTEGRPQPGAHHTKTGIDAAHSSPRARTRWRDAAEAERMAETTVSAAASTTSIFTAIIGRSLCVFSR